MHDKRSVSAERERVGGQICHLHFSQIRVENEQLDTFFLKNGTDWKLLLLSLRRTVKI